MHRSNKWQNITIITIVLIVVVLSVVVNIQYEKEGLSKVAETINIDNGDQSINWERYPTFEITLDEAMDIIQPGTYHITGTLEDAGISINAGGGEVRLILDNVTINNSNGPAIACYSAENLVIELVGENSLSDGPAYASNYDEDVNGVIYSKADLTFDGDGSLALQANYQDGIVGKDDLKFISGSYDIASVDDGIRGKDSVYILDGSFIIDATSDAIKATNDTTTGKGFILVEDGNFNLVASGKGLQSTSSILIYGGNYIISTKDDAIHSDSYLGIKDGQFNINSGDDGLHANKELTVDGGEINVVMSYEGMEAQVVTINDGRINLVSQDDGINAGGGADLSATMHQEAGVFDADENCQLTINGGEITINASGDGIDSNGWLYFNGGTVVVDGPTNNGNGALDSGMGIVMNGGEVLAVGASGMATTFGTASSIYNVSIYITSTQPANTRITIKDSSGKEIFSHQAKKTFDHIAAGSPMFELGETYTVYFDDINYQNFTISGVTTTVGSNKSNNSQFGPQRRK